MPTNFRMEACKFCKCLCIKVLFISFREATRRGGGQFRDAMSPTKLTPEPPYTCSITSKPRKTVDDLKVILLIMRLRRSYRGAEWPCTPSLATVCQEASLYFGQESGNHCQQEEIIHSEESRMEGVGGGSI